MDGPAQTEFYLKFLGMKSLLKSNIIGLGALLGLSFALISITNHYILTINFYNNSGDLFSGIPDQESAVYESLQKWVYIGTASYLIVKLFLIALVLYTALYLSDQAVSFGKIFNITVLAEFVFIIPAVLKIIWFHHGYPNGTILDWHRMYVLSALSLFESAPADWYYPLQTLNVFEIIYWFLLAFGIYKVTKMDYDTSLRLVLFSYVPSLFIWIATVAFCTIMMFPNNG